MFLHLTQMGKAVYILYTSHLKTLFRSPFRSFVNTTTFGKEFVLRYQEGNKGRKITSVLHFVVTTVNMQWYTTTPFKVHYYSQCGGMLIMMYSIIVIIYLYILQKTHIYKMCCVGLSLSKSFVLNPTL